MNFNFKRFNFFLFSTEFIIISQSGLNVIHLHVLYNVNDVLNGIFVLIIIIVLIVISQ